MKPATKRLQVKLAAGAVGLIGCLTMGRVCILGLDGLSPNLLFVDYWSRLPNFRRLARRSLWGTLASCNPPITVPAWACMVTGVDPGVLGCYGFSDRADRSYGRRRLASSLSYTQPPLWTLLSQAGRRCRVLGVPQTYPAKPLHGSMVTGALTPTMNAPYSTYPPELAATLAALPEPYIADIDNFRSLTPAALVQAVQAMTATTFRLLDDWLAQPDWDFLMAVDMGADRLQHGLWAYTRIEHPHFVPRHALADALGAYYVQLDAYVGRVMDALAADDLFWVVSDHGAQAMQGGFAINDWLRQTNRLVLHHSPAASPPVCRLQPQHVNWSRTTAWADGGYVGRIYLNVVGREPQGTVPPADVAPTLAALTAELAALPEFGHGRHRTHRPQDIYLRVHGIAPDLLVYMNDLRRRALGTLGHPSLWPATNDCGADGANHAQDGIFFMTPPPRAAAASTTASLYDVAPTVLHYLDVAIPEAMTGRSLLNPEPR